MALSSQALCTLTELKAYLNIGDSHKDGLLEDCIEDASQKIIKYIGYDPHSQAYTDEVYDGSGDYSLITKARPVTAISAVKEWDGDTWTSIDATDLAQMISREWYIDGHEYRFSTGRSAYKVTYTAGYGDTDCNEAFSVPCMKLAAWLEKEAGKAGLLGMASTAPEGGGSRSVYENVIETLLADLSPYRRIAW